MKNKKDAAYLPIKIDLMKSSKDISDALDSCNEKLINQRVTDLEENY